MVLEKQPDQEPPVPQWTSTPTHSFEFGQPGDLQDDGQKKHTANNPSTSLWDKFLGVVFYTPPWSRYDPARPPKWSLWYNVLFAFAGAFTVGNLYYSHPILNVLAEDFNVSYVEVSRLPTLMQAGYCTGLLFVCPLGDLFKRRPLTLTLIFMTATMWIGLCITTSFSAFCIIGYLSAITTVIPQVMLPLVSELAPPEGRALALSITTSGNLLGIVIARILSGVVTNYTYWRNIFWIALALQYSILIVLWFFMPDYPSSNPEGLNYLKMLWGILFLYKKHAVLVQVGLISYCISACFTSYWTTLTFLLADPPYNYPSVIIGLFGLIGIAGIIMTPVYAKYIIQPFAPTFSCLIGWAILLVGIVVGTYSGRYTVVGPIVQALSLDAGFQICQVANRAAIHALEPTGRNRVNTAFMLLSFLGQMTGTSAGAELYERGGWRASGSLSVGFVALILILSVVRGPYEKGWFGWSGGWDIRKQNLAQATEVYVSPAAARSGKKDVDVEVPIAPAMAQEGQTNSPATRARSGDEENGQLPLEPGKTAGTDKP
ncbi:hypothetical protein, variant [Exophiala mesophila]|uniref:Major facilitator superfamily (MFS) profile domain-containing protein n=1 Tax=Exophiala mesophila TaxID=212818 RepID=A0A0D1ZNJ8_EXOME|nr:uncharacterized protein PV10_08063 [Exophiala mesophila]XP_016219947.1 hypothetical protein, variant [Exophiala mesophila]KIV88372.1 hypothetical protein PV10_08063 [Exophiala mesophila]KIV88373.1 hypothetical protein, variant [Exophiala mesophila]